MILIYKILPRLAWEAAVAVGRYRGSPVDLADGYIHFSAADQVAATAEKYFAGQQDLIVLTVDAASLGDSLKWERSRGGTLFPHLYGLLECSQVMAASPAPRWPDDLPDLQNLVP